MATLNVTPNPVEQGAVITCHFGGFFHRDSVWVGVVNGGYGSAMSDDIGAGNISFALSEQPGNYTMEAWDDWGNYASMSFVIVAALIPTPGWVNVDRVMSNITLDVVFIPTPGWVQVGPSMTASVALDIFIPTPGWVQVARATSVCELGEAVPTPGWLNVDRVTATIIILTPIITLKPNSGKPASEFMLTGKYFTPGWSSNLRFGAETLGVAIADAKGVLTGTFTVPANSTDGKYDVSASTTATTSVKTTFTVGKAFTTNYLVPIGLVAAGVGVLIATNKPTTSKKK